MNNAAVSTVTGDSYLAGEDDDFVNRPGGFILQELADDETAKCASSDDSKIFVPGHVSTRCYSSCSVGTNEYWVPLSSYLSLLQVMGAAAFESPQPQRHPEKRLACFESLRTAKRIAK